jgi:hypothetical protein
MRRFRQDAGSIRVTLHRSRDPRPRASGVEFHDYDLPGLKTLEHVCVLGSEKAAWFSDTEGNVLCLHEEIAKRQ